MADLKNENKLQRAKDTIKYFANRHQCKIPVPKDKTELANWSEARLFGHIAYYIAKKQFKHKEAEEKAEMITNVINDFLA